MPFGPPTVEQYWLSLNTKLHHENEALETYLKEREQELTTQLQDYRLDYHRLAVEKRDLERQVWGMEWRLQRLLQAGWESREGRLDRPTAQGPGAWRP